MDVLFSFPAFGANLVGRVAIKAIIVRGLMLNIKKRPVFAVEFCQVISNEGSHGPFRIIGIRAVVEDPRFRQSRGHPPDFAESTGCCCGPAEIFTGHLFPSPLRFVRTRTHKLVYNMVGRGELYDLVDDPGELNNLFGHLEVADIQKALMSQMREHMVRLEDPLLRQFDIMRHVY